MGGTGSWLKRCTTPECLMRFWTTRGAKQETCARCRAKAADLRAETVRAMLPPPRRRARRIAIERVPVPEREAIWLDWARI